ncbi:MAG: hypothetical protein BAJALOKI2v1_20039 [Promethearchaeota archaeon]|nr:MAG: hypothetical protein BAJALOKI2v1_20039 [Candidatus Lokiarchaeota archaeon]
MKTMNVNEKPSKTEKSEKFTKRGIIIRSIATMIYLLILGALFFYFLNLTTNIIVIISILSFLFLVFLGVILRKGKFNLISRLFPTADKKMSLFNDTKKENSITPPEHISYEFKYKRPLIRKCPDCGFIIPSFSKKCPKCGKKV